MPFRYLLFFAILILSCSKKPDKDTTLYRDLSPDFTGVAFSNDIIEDSLINYFTYPYIYMGGGVAVGDLNSDGLQDLFFTGNRVPNRLYLNDGDLQFTDISDQAGIKGDDRWMTGVNMADVNGDGWLDIYVSVSGKFTTTKNLLYINQGVGSEGLPTFKEMAEDYGIADEGHSTQGTFFDYDNDGDLDLYVVNYPYTDFKTRNQTYRVLLDEKTLEHSDKLYRNDGENGFTDVTTNSGIQNFGLGLSATCGDLNNDGWLDLYISNDFASPDFLYLNNGDGTFSEELNNCTQHTAYFGMGADIADYNNDGLYDLFQLDMTPENNRRNKANMASMNIPGFWEMIYYGLGYQYMKNTLQLNRGIRPDGKPILSDIGYLSGTSLTDWSWAALFADLDRDGNKDLLISNGIRRDINNKDYFHDVENMTYDEKSSSSKLELSQNIPAEKVPNYFFKNGGDLTTKDMTETWGLYYNGYSNGMSYADLDNDGDLEIIVNNIDDPVKIYQSLASENQINHYLGINFLGPKYNSSGIGAKAILYTDQGNQYLTNTPTRGFQSSVDNRLLFGIESNTVVTKLEIYWPDGNTSIIENPELDSYYTIRHSESSIPSSEVETSVKKFAFAKNRLLQKNIDFKHIENDYNDFTNEILIPYQYSRLGPALATGDINGDGLDDFYVGGAAQQSGTLYQQNQSGSFDKISISTFSDDRYCEDIDAVFYDYDGDNDVDLYVVSGGNDYKSGNPYFQDRLYENLGNGNFQKTEGVLPEFRLSGAKVLPLDYDGDGDLDLFVGTRMKPQNYPLSEESILLTCNTSEEKVSYEITRPEKNDLANLGMVTDAVWDEAKNHLVVVGEWMPVTTVKLSTSEIIARNAPAPIKTNGWWQSITLLDDDYSRYAIGNLGQNFKYQASQEESFDVYSYDFDQNGSLDIVLGYYYDDQQYPLRGRQCSSEQIPTIKYKFKNYNDYADATIQDVYTKEDLAKATHLQAFTFESGVLDIDNEDMIAFPSLAQISNINSIIPFDYNGDEYTDLLVTGNLFMTEVETPRNDASIGLVLLGQEGGSYYSLDYSETGLYLPYDTKHSSLIKTPKGESLITVANNDSLYVFDFRPPKPLEE